MEFAQIAVSPLPVYWIAKQVTTPQQWRPQGSVLAPLLFNISIDDQPVITSRKFAYVDDSAIMHATSNWKALKETLSQDMETISSCLQKLKLKFSTAKTVSAAFHLNNKEARRELSISIEGRALSYCAEPTYLGIKLYRLSRFANTLSHCAKN